MKTTEDRFWEKVAVSTADQCWEWQAGRFQPTGYGCFGFQGRGWGAHRMAWTLTFGEIPEGDWVLHRCDNKLCCNPGHLFLGTPKDNVQDMIAKGRQNYPRGDEHYLKRHPEKIARGEQRVESSLTDAQVVEIRRRRALGQLPKQIAGEMGLKQDRVADAAAGRTWKHLPLVERPKPTHCRRGHEYTAENRFPSTPPDRLCCKTCLMEAQRRRRAKFGRAKEIAARKARQQADERG
jgi:hypothetical protein